ncbi:GNAT family N-acetyltransferase [Thiomicrorhabdus xiamenensis]|nr:GNAT family N-acetyltransferase [Thiomicrorhabdus xiamenensis]
MTFRLFPAKLGTYTLYATTKSMPEKLPEITFEVIDSIDRIDANQWNRLHQSSYPFIQHQYLAALERHGCVSERFGWIPKHLLLRSGGDLIAAMPLYEKHNNYGEFVFDQPWEQAWNSIGLNYYPKLVSAIPYTPARGPRLLIHPDFRNNPQLIEQIIETLKSLSQQQEYSGFHLLFSDEQAELAKQPEILSRHDVQFQWFNQQYRDFDGFLATLKSKKRKNIRRERKSVKEQGIDFRCLDGRQTTDKDWLEFDYFYQKTFLEKWSTPTLNFDFFREIAHTMADKILLVLADKDGETVAGALMFKSDQVLYGRHWGCREQIKDLHFEACFYQGIEFAITHGLQRFEPGAGGEHKIARGFVPVRLQSSHWLTVNPFVEPLNRFIHEEREVIAHYIDDLWQSSPYQETENLQRLAQESEKVTV